MVLEKLIFAAPPNRAPDELRIIWAQVTSPCIAENASILISIVFLASLLLSFIKSRVCNGLGKTREVRNHLIKDVKYGASYNVTAVCSVLSFIGQVASLLLVYLGNSNIETQCESKEMLLWSKSMQGISWALTLVTLYKIRDQKSIRFPWILRLWWISNFLLSLWHATLDARFVMGHGQLRVQEYAELTGFLASFCLLVLSIRGNIGVAPSLDQEASEPLLNGKHENQSSLRNDCPYGRATLIQLVTFSWLNPLFEVGFKKVLDQEDVPNLDANDSAAFLSQQFDGCLKYTKEQGSTSTASIYKSIYLFIRKKAVINAVFAVTSAGTSYVGPYLMNNFVTFLNEKKYRSLQSGYLLALGFLGAKLVETIAQRQWIFGARQLGLRLRAALISHIYKKGLALTSTSRQSRTSGEMINFMSVDVQRITDFIWYMNTIWMLPVQIGLAMYILQLNLGMGALVSFVAVLIVMAINIPLTTYQKRYQTKIMEAKDNRMKATSEVLRNMKTLKLQAWDSYYLEKIENLRKIEHNWLFKSQRLNAFGAFIFWGSPAFISVVSFCGCYIMGIPLTAGTVLSSLATFRMLQDPIFNLPDLLNIIAQGKVSVDRISSYLQEDEIQVDAVENIPDNYTYQVEIDSGRFSWDKDSINPTLDQINMRVKRGMKVAICGTVGSGKSSLLSCILGEMHKLVGTVKISGSKAYVPQSAWILTGNIRENIIFGRPYESEKYLRVIEACALAKDFELFAAGDLTEIGERGINMSGGQKQRIQIARAVYQDADVYLLDDPFSAVDAHTGTQLYQDCLMGILKEKTVLYVTHQIEFLHAADLILVMQNGKIAQAGTFQELLEQNIGFEVLVGAHSQALESVRTVNTSRRPCECVPEPVENENDSDNTGNHEFLQSKQESEHNLSVEITEQDGRLVQDEEREKGSISKEVYMSYLTTVKRGALIPIILLAQTSFQALQITSNYWMAWACPNAKSQPTVPINIVLLIYALLGLGSALCVLLRASLVAITGLFTSEKLFSKMLHSVLRAPMAFFDSTPAGRILNRASMDQSVLDLEMANKLGWCAFSVIQLLGTIAVMSQVAWEVFVIFIPVTGICIWYQRYYNPTARELARLSGIRRAPILHHFSESLTGASTIRAFNHQKRFTDINLRLIDNHSRPWFHNVSAMEWLSFRLNQLSNFVFGFSLILLVSLPDGVINPSIAGLAVTYGINLNVLQASVIWNICNAENKMISVERILQYSNLASEGPLIIEDCRPPVYWPHLGSISFTNLQIRYAEHLPSVLKDITCTFPGRRKVGVVGRTGSGKSTLIQAIFRIVEAREGSVAIDNIDISKIGLHDLRQRLSIIPQDPAMFEGCVRGNLDPLGQYPDHEIWRALDKCQLGDLVRQKPEKLEAVVVENGENWSVGQRQLFCLGRALLKKSSILVLDEATASVDSATDGIIQKIIGEEFKERTVITIAHRIHTVIDSDLVLVLSDGRIAEYDTPSKLLEQENSLFSKLIKEYSMKSQSLK